MKILVTGATGTIGKKVVNTLAKKGVNVRAGVHSKDKTRSLKETGAEVVILDYDLPETIDAALNGVDKMFLLTPMAENQAEMAREIVTRSKKAGIKHIVRLSALGADHTPGIQLERWHREAEKEVMESGIPYTILRPAMFMDNYANFMKDAIKKGTFYTPQGEARMAMIDTRDIAAVAAEALTGKGHENKIYTLTGGKAISNAEAAETFTRLFQRKVTYVDVPDTAAREAMTGQGLPGWIIDSMMELHQAVRKGGQEEPTGDVKEVLGRDPYTFEEFVEENREAFA